MERVRLGHNTRDTLLLTFRDAKVPYDTKPTDYWTTLGYLNYCRLIVFVRSIVAYILVI